MKQLAKTQKLTLFLLITYVALEISGYLWRSNLPKEDPVIPVDLVII